MNFDPIANRAISQLALLLLLFSGCQKIAAKEDTGAETSNARIVSIGGPVTETVFALGAGPSVVAVDTSSVFPAKVSQLPQVGYQSRISAEGVLAQNPTIVVVGEEAGPPAALAQIKSAGIPLVVVQKNFSVRGAVVAIEKLASALDKTENGMRLVEAIQRHMPTALGKADDSPRVLFVYARGHNVLSVGGRDTAADAMIRLAGVRNAMTDFSGYKALTAEAVVAAEPDIVLIPSRGLSSLGGTAAVLALPGLSLTPAGKHGRVIAMDDLLLLGFGPRLATAVTQLQAEVRRLNIGPSK